MRESYPGWEPSTCGACYRSAKGGGASGTGTSSAGTKGAGPKQAASRPSGSGTETRSAGRRSGAAEDLLTLSEVLERYHDGPDTGVFTDGSANPNPGPGGWGAVYVVDGEVIDQAYGHEPATTNNRMELTALLAGVELVPIGTPATLYSDSNLAVRTVTEWAPGWEARGWRRKTGPVENLDLVRPLYEVLRSRPELTVRWIKAHAGNRWNEYADSLATAYARDEL